MNYLQFQVSKNKFSIKQKGKIISIFSNYVWQHLLGGWIIVKEIRLSDKVIM